MVIMEVLLQHMWRSRFLHLNLKNIVLEEIVAQQNITSRRPYDSN